MEQVDIYGDKIEIKTDEIEKETKISIFDIINDISYDKKNIFDESVFNIFLTVKAFSQHHDTILYANEVNKRSFGNKLFAHDFLFNTISKKKRYGKWAKSLEEDKILNLIKRKYHINNDVAHLYLNMMTNEDKNNIEKEFLTGGR